MAAVVAYAFVTAPAARLTLAPLTTPTIAVGAYHVHTTRSDGGFTPDEVARAARDAHLSFVILTDHGDASREPDPPRYVDGVLMIDAVEISVVEGHLTALGLPGAAPYRFGGEARDVIEDIHRLGGLAIVAHPDSPRPDLRWRPSAAAGNGRGGALTDLAGADGLEWLNADSEWRDEGTLRMLQTAITFPLRPSESLAHLMSRPRASLRRWDAVTARRAAIGLAATDTHGFGGRFYAATLGTVAQVVDLTSAWSGEPAADARLVLDAIRAGRTWSVVTGFASPAAVRLTARSAGQQATMGETVTLAGAPVDLTAAVDHVSNARVAIWHDEREVASGMGAVTFQTSEPGGYRAEVSLTGFAMPWVVTNPIYLRAGAPPSAPAPPPRATASPRNEVAMSLMSPDGWSIEHGPSSAGSLTQDDGLRFHFEVGTVRPGLEYAALARSMGDGLESFDRLEFTASASSPMRVLVQFRLPGGTDGERWSRSIYLDQTPRPITVRMTDVAPVGFQATRRPVVARVKSILFVVDTLNTAPGTTGDVRLTDVRLARAASGADGK